MANNIIKRIWNQNKMVQIEDLKGMAFQAEDGGHTFEIYGMDEAGETVTLTGTPSGVFLRPDNTDVVLDCSVSDGVVSATLPDECYDVPGRGGLTVFITADGKKTALYAAVVTVSRTSSGNVAPPATQTVVDLINAISAAVATIPASYTDLMADIAPTYSTSALYAVGQYAWYDGDLKRCIVPITTAESYTAAHWTSAVLGNDVSDLKSALFLYETKDFWKNGAYDKNTGAESSSTTRIISTIYVGEITGEKKVEALTGYDLVVYGFTSTGTYLGNLCSDNTFKKSGGTTIWVKEFNCLGRTDGAVNFKFMMRNSNDPSATIAPSAGQNCLFYRTTDDDLTKAGESADAKITGDKIEELKKSVNAFTGCRTIDFIPWKYIVTSGSTVDIATIVNTNEDWQYAVVDASENDQFIINCSGGINPRAWCFIDNSGNALKKAGESSSIRNLSIVAPANTAKLILNGRQTDSPSYYVGKIPINRNDPNPFVRIIGEGDIVLSVLDPSTGGIGVASSRGATPCFIPVNPGDSITRNHNDVGIIVSFYDDNGNFVRSSANTYQWNDKPYFVLDGEAFIRIGYRKNNVDNPSISDFADMITITRFSERTEMITTGILNRVEHSTSAEMIHGYLNGSTGAISPHEKYMVTTKYHRVRPGDIVRCAKEELNIWVIEYDLSLNKVRGSSQYVRRHNKNPYPAGEWHVKTDGYVRAHFANYNAQEEVDIATNGDALEIVHSLSNLAEYDAVRTKWITPTGYIKPHIIREGQDRGAQASVIIDGYLYVSTDDYAGTYTIQKVDMATGETLKTYSHDLGHCACMDYCPETDTFLTFNGNIILYPNFKQALTGDSLDLADCIQITNDLPNSTTFCFGEDKYTVYGFEGYNGIEIKNVAYKVKLGYADNDLSENGYGTYTESNSYNGTAALVKMYKGEIREFHDGLFGYKNASYAQDCKYDGHFYLAYGTCGYNCFVIDFDELADMYHVVGNYKWIYRNDAYADQYGEAEAVAINGSKIVSVLRDWTDNISVMFEFNR